MDSTARRVSYFFLCALPLIFAVVAPRPLRVAGIHEVAGAVLFVAMVAAAWVLGARRIAAAEAGGRLLALAGALLVLPWALIALLWVGIGAPFQATTPENHMRFLLLLSNSIVVACAFVVLSQALRDAGERFYSTIGLATSIPAGVAYIGCMSLISAAYVARLRSGQPAEMGLLSDVFDVLEFFACALTYLTTAAFAASLGRAGLLGRGPARAYMLGSAVLLLLLVMRGLSYPDLGSSDTPWYVHVTWIAGIPAIPWMMPGLLGVVVLRRVGLMQN